MDKTQQVDYLIVGQGLAGTLLSHFLLLENQRVGVLDFPHQGRTTNIAAGLINPVTGRRIAKSWRFEELYKFAKQTYQELETKLGERLWHDRRILRALYNVFEENEWARRSGYPEFDTYLNDAPDASDLGGIMHPPYAWGELLGCAQVALPLLIEVWQKRLRSEGVFYEENFDYEKIRFENERVRYGRWEAKKLIFCEGAKAVENPFFKHLPFLPSKGELLILRIPGLPAKRIIKHKLFFVPIEDGLFWVGSTSNTKFQGSTQSEEGRAYLLEQINKSLFTPFEVVNHLAGIRPTVADLRPLLGLHSDFLQLGIFNGLGTKGALMGPYFAKQMSDFLIGKGELEIDVDISRLGEGSRSGHFFK